MTNETTEITVYGASARAACWSAVRAGLKPSAFDQFCDLDFPVGCDVRLLSERELLLSGSKELRKNQTEFCLPVGGWENDVTTMQRLESIYSLWNTGSTATKRARNPFLVQKILREANLPNLNVRDACGNDDPAQLVHSDSRNQTGIFLKFASRSQTFTVSNTEKWIRKPFAGTGGIGIKRIRPASDKCEPDCYDQQYVQGESFSAIFFASHAGEINLLGITQQLIGCDELPDRPFAYVGSVGPALSSNNEREGSIRLTLQKMAEALNKQIRFYGLFCFDFVVSRNSPYLVEINPRYSASVEVLELVFRQSFLQLFSKPWDCCSAPQRRIGKSILFAGQEMQLPGDWDWNLVTQKLAGKNWNYDQWSVPVLSDLPLPGTRFSIGDPICTVWAEGQNIQSCRTELSKRMRRLKRIMEDQQRNNEIP